MDCPICGRALVVNSREVHFQKTNTTDFAAKPVSEDWNQQGGGSMLAIACYVGSCLTDNLAFGWEQSFRAIPPDLTPASATPV